MSISCPWISKEPYVYLTLYKASIFGYPEYWLFHDTDDLQNSLLKNTLNIYILSKYVLNITVDILSCLQVITTENEEDIYTCISGIKEEIMKKNKNKDTVSIYIQMRSFLVKIDFIDTKTRLSITNIWFSYEFSYYNCLTNGNSSKIW